LALPMCNDAQNACLNLIFLWMDAEVSKVRGNGWECHLMVVHPFATADGTDLRVMTKPTQINLSAG